MAHGVYGKLTRSTLGILIGTQEVQQMTGRQEWAAEGLKAACVEEEWRKRLRMEATVVVYYPIHVVEEESARAGKQAVRIAQHGPKCETRYTYILFICIL